MRVRLNAFLALGRELARIDTPVSGQEIQRRLNIPQTAMSQSALYNWFDHMEFQRVLSRTSKGFQVDRVRLLDFYSAYRVVRAKPVFEITTSLSGPDLVRHLRNHAHPDVALGFLSAANEWAFFEPRDKTEVYASREAIRQLRTNLPEGNRTVTVFSENWSEIPVTDRSGVPATDLFLTIIDCRAHPEGGAHAYFLEKDFLWGKP